MTNLADIIQFINDRRRDSGSNSIDMNAEGFRAINGTLNYWNQSHDWEFQIEESIIKYNEGITWYSVPTAYKGPVDLRTYRTPRTAEFDMVSASTFDSQTLKSKRFAIATVKQKEYLRIKTSGNIAQLHTLSGTATGTWAVGGAISNLDDNSYEYFDLSSCVQFDYSGTSGTITIDFANAVDIKQFINRSSIYWNANFSTFTNWTSMTWKIGSDASNYYTGSSTTDYLGKTPTDDEFNKFKIAWSDLTKVGSPDNENIDWAQIIIAYSSNPSITGLKLENLFISEDVPLLFEYYSTNMVIAAGSGSAKTQTFTSTANTTDMPLWSGKNDFITETFINSCLENIFFMTGEITDYQITQNKIASILNNLKQRIPSRRRYPNVFVSFDI